jgi:hypothetical protein
VAGLGAHPAPRGVPLGSAADTCHCVSTETGSKTIPVKQGFDPRTVEVAWRLVETPREGVRSLEYSVTRVGTAQLAGAIALWTQLYTFDETVAAVMAWCALVLLLVSILLLAVLVTPRPLARFWEAIPTKDVLVSTEPFPLDEEVALLRQMREAMTTHIRRLRGGLRLSVLLACIALVCVFTAYAIEKSQRGTERPALGWTFS